MLNEELLQQVADKIREVGEDGWDQAAYVSGDVCGTKYCVAGWTLVLSGYTVENQCFFTPDGTLVRYEDQEAATLLGLTGEVQSVDIFFYKMYSPVTVEEMVDRMSQVTGVAL
jgi:hypothetical protein